MKNLLKVNLCLFLSLALNVDLCASSKFAEKIRKVVASGDDSNSVKPRAPRHIDAIQTVRAQSTPQMKPAAKPVELDELSLFELN